MNNRNFLKKFSYFIFMLLALSLVTSSFIFDTHAQSPQKTSTPSAQINPILEKINAIKAEAASKAAELKSVISKNLQNKVYFGKIIRIDDTQITLQGRNNQKIVKVNEYTLYQEESNSKAKVDLTDLETDDFLASLGDVDDKNILNAKKIVRLRNSAAETKATVWGMVQNVNVNKISILRAGGKEFTVTLSSQTNIMLGSEEATIQDISQNKIIVVYGKTSSNALNADYIYIGSRGGNLKPIKQTATPSASAKN